MTEDRGAKKVIGLLNAKELARSKAGSQPQILLSQSLLSSYLDFNDLKEALLEGGRTEMFVVLVKEQITFLQQGLQCNF